jgi:mannan endo-1,4-beta-mannosidase
MKKSITLAALVLALSQSFAASDTALAKAPRPASAARTGYYVVGSKLYSPDGVEFRIRGVNKLHWDQTASIKGIPLTGANTVRVAVNLNKTESVNLGVVNPIVKSGLLVIPGAWNATCKSDPAALKSIVDQWVAQASTWTTLNDTGLINIANEWGPNRTTRDASGHMVVSTVWRDAYIDAVRRMRAAGYTGTLVIDAGGCGQDASTVTGDGGDVLAADPLHNILFDIHVYGGFAYPARTVAWQTQDYKETMATIGRSGLPIIFGEFGPGSFVNAAGAAVKVGPSGTLLPPEVLVADAERMGLGWLVWAWDDNNLGNCKTSENGWFGMTNNCGTYTGKDSELTAFGRQMVRILQTTR